MNSSTRLMASPAAAPASEFTTVEAARQSLIAISQSVPEIEAAVVARPPSGGGMKSERDDGAEQRYRNKLISISNQSPDARPALCPPKNAAA
ncbi:hypothetical protein HU200_063267 [Digitaria exilis]|uniref:Uncharacterized protein n=1 Tax=Digitaria exilis TaxID=1010633 RepID=A0A835A684_9POAL|nr:hypothetical protein HU200_063267 [Digitaria exilis]